MENDFQSFEKALTSKDIAAMVGIAESTVRKYAAALEDAGYPFTKDGDGEKAARIFTGSDAMVMRHLKELREKANVPVEQAAQIVASKHPKGMLQVAAFDATAFRPNIDMLISTINERHEERYSALEMKVDEQSAQIEKLIEMNSALFTALDELSTNNSRLTEIVTAQKAIAAGSEDQREERERLRDEKLTQVLREIQEAKAAANKSVWKRIFGG